LFLAFTSTKPSIVRASEPAKPRSLVIGGLRAIYFLFSPATRRAMFAVILPDFVATPCVNIAPFAAILATPLFLYRLSFAIFSASYFLFFILPFIVMPLFIIFSVFGKNFVAFPLFIILSNIPILFTSCRRVAHRCALLSYLGDP
jgi:hypothetical protein